MSGACQTKWRQATQTDHLGGPDRAPVPATA